MSSHSDTRNFFLSVAHILGIIIGPCNYLISTRSASTVPFEVKICGFVSGQNFPWLQTGGDFFSGNAFKVKHGC
jgi:hypothetical protein